MIKALRYIILLTFSLFFLTITSPVLAAENWVIDNFQSQINIQTDGKVEVTETIDVDFGTVTKHGIFRDIPYIYYSDNGSNIYTDIQLQSVTQNETITPVRESKTGIF